jgi:Tol biopolymer transport system component
MPQWARRGLLLAFAPLFLCCNSNYPNPFVAQKQQSVTPAATDDIVFTSDLYSASPTGLLEVYSLNAATGQATRLTFCNQVGISCSALEASFAPDRKRVAIVEVTRDTNGDGQLTAADGAALTYIDLSRGVQANLVQDTAAVDGVDWSPADGVIAYSAAGTGGPDDLYSIGTDGTNNQDLSQSPGIAERKPRFDLTGSVLTFERIVAGGKGQAYVLDLAGQAVLVDAGGDGTATIPGTPYIVGADADPVFSPDSSTVLFRRLTATLGGTLGTWDLLKVASGGSGLQTFVTGPLYRGAPDWGPSGVLYVEEDPATRISSIIFVNPDGTGRKTVLTAPAGFTLSTPRWLPAAP